MGNIVFDQRRFGSVKGAQRTDLVVFFAHFWSARDPDHRHHAQRISAGVRYNVSRIEIHDTGSRRAAPE